MERIAKFLKDEKGAVPIFIAVPLAGFALWQVIRQLKNMNREIMNTRKENGPVDFENRNVIDGEIVGSLSHKATEGQGR